MRNQPKYHFLKNTSYALKGLRDIITHETSFRLELILVLILSPLIYFVPLELSYQLLMFIALMGMPIAEAMNSAIERVTDLVTLEYHEMAGRAKDVGSAVVFLSIVVFVVVWFFCLFKAYM
ncbi:diacylglycerol kinase [Sulfurospirillum barnesii]|uniref:Diacylglycerol kinase n=1 Tax=Sulfurospirillum barnesii (strain ATCC 700032 / DSM 10660 / SES-3) TaxID=760154 RepID=I3XU21_SULBS|nr:diacylglycerol kinase [Sulfurospirillum barnesii]AFL67445.1 diacylglycerol kinase [Sulfurospirillum barnesii SES-3]